MKSNLKGSIMSTLDWNKPADNNVGRMIWAESGNTNWVAQPAYTVRRDKKTLIDGVFPDLMYTKFELEESRERRRCVGLCDDPDRYFYHDNHDTIFSSNYRCIS